MEQKWQARLAVVLVRARNPSNIGAVARAMHDFGYTDLRVVNQYPVPFAAAKSAVDASSVVEGAQEFTSLAEAVADCNVVYGTTAVGERVIEHPLHALGAAAVRIRTELGADSGTRVALVFGSEKTGLSNDELSHCHALLTIPMNAVTGKHLSMNLGQAAAVCLYAIAQVRAAAESASVEVPAAAGELERLLGLLRAALDTSGYTKRHPANSREATLRRLVLRMGLTASDAPVWTGILRMVLRKMQRPDTDDTD